MTKNNNLEKTRVVLVRHGQSTYNEEKRYQGCCDESVLTEKGKQQAFQTGIALSKINFDAVYTSPLQRTQQTAREIIKANNNRARLISKFHINSNLKEVNLPTWEGLYYKYVRQEFAEEYKIWSETPHEFTIEGVESRGKTLIATKTKPVLELYQKAQNFWRKILPLHQGKTILVASHGGTIRALIGTAAGIKAENYHGIQQSNSGISIINFEHTTSEPLVKIEAVNRTQHLGEVLPKLKNGKQGLRLLLLPLNSDIQERQYSEKIANFLKNTQLDFCISNNTENAQFVTESIIKLQSNPPVNLQVLRNNFLSIWHQTISKRSQNHHGLSTGLVVVDENTISNSLSQILGLYSQESLQINPGEISIIFYPASQTKPVLQAMNITVGNQ